MIRDWIETLIGLPDHVWDAYAFAREPLAGKITPEMRLEFAKKSRNCALDYAHRVNYNPETGDLEAVVRAQGIKLDFDIGKDGGAYSMFAKFTVPDEISICRESAIETDALIEEENLFEMLGDVKTENVLLAHEFFHYFEFADPDAYTLKKHLLLWKLGPLKNESSIGALEEIGAMAFAQQLLGLAYSPYVFDVLMLYPDNQQRAKAVYDAIMTIADRQAGFGEAQERKEG